jgi:hypothetical protein
MTTLIYKGTFSPVPARSFVSVPGVSPAVIAVHLAEPTFWYSFRPDDAYKSSFEILTAWTGQAFDAAGFNYAGTSLLPGELVAHLYWRRVE